MSRHRPTHLGWAAVVAVLTVLPLAGCGGESFDDYCEAVSQHRTDLSRTLNGDEVTGVFDALPAMKALQEQAPDDIKADWNTLVDAISSLRDALADADVDPETYDPEKPPEQISAEEQSAIEAAARRLGNDATREAGERVQQHARDVCQTPLLL